MADCNCRSDASPFTMNIRAISQLAPESAVRTLSWDRDQGCGWVACGATVCLDVQPHVAKSADTLTLWRSRRRCAASPGARCPRLQQYDWPGNVRELENIIERGVALATRTVLQMEDLPFDLA